LSTETLANLLRNAKEVSRWELHTLLGRVSEQSDPRLAAPLADAGSAVPADDDARYARSVGEYLRAANGVDKKLRNRLARLALDGIVRNLGSDTPSEYRWSTPISAMRAMNIAEPAAGSKGPVLAAWNRVRQCVEAGIAHPSVEEYELFDVARDIGRPETASAALRAVQQRAAYFRESTLDRTSVVTKWTEIVIKFGTPPEVDALLRELEEIRAKKWGREPGMKRRLARLYYVISHLPEARADEDTRTRAAAGLKALVPDR